MKNIFILAILTFLLGDLVAQKVSRQVLSPFAYSENFSSAGFKVSHSLGELATKTMIGNNQKVTQGFQQPDCVENCDDTNGTPLCAEVEVQNIITPNGDKKNDEWIIDEFGELGQASLSVNVYNRWGVNVYTNPNYQNQWMGGDLPEGTYYYVLIVNEEKPCKGTLTILREE